MIQTMKRSLALLMVLVMCLAFVPALFLSTSAAEVSYKYSGNYIYNWGTRGETATFLSPNAEKFYANDTYEELSSYSGGTGTSNAPQSELYDVLQDLMVSAHRHQTSYSETKNLYQYTDCQNNGGKISSFYSGKAIGPSWDGSWNREHTWPNSKGLGGNDENDIMMLRPTSASENSSRGNKAYGESSGYYNPNSESGNQHDLRGDVARIFLYMYVRWGNVNGNGQYSTWGSGGVMESLDVLLAWMEIDPVDTWELGRNDSVESITGTRNVFVDYPEFAFLLFGVEIPEDMTTPSGEASNAGDKCDHNNFGTGKVTAPTCTEKGYTIYICQTANCGYSYKANIIPAKGHNYAAGVCTACGEAEPAAPVKPNYVTEVIPGKAYKLGFYSTDKSAEYFFNGSMTGYYGATDTSYENGVDVYAEQTAGGYHLYFTSGNTKQYINLVASGTYRNFTFATTATSVFTWDAAKSAFCTTVSGETCYIGTFGYYVTMGVLQTSKLQNTDYIARFYTMGAASGDHPSCQHDYRAVVTDPTCENEGYTTYTCILCNDMYLDEKLPAKGHVYANGTCTRCGAAKPSQTELVISFDTTANRTVFNKSQQVWVQNGIVVTNDKGSATSDVADYCKPVRFYKGSNVTIAYPGMTKIEINCSNLDAKYVDSWLNVANATATKNNGIVTVVFDAPVDSFVYTNLLAQVRAYSITVYAEAQTAECEHPNTVVEGATEATCDTDGHTGKTYCPACETVLDEGETIPATGHVFAAWIVIKTPTCTSAGLERKDCDKCTSYETKQIPALGHTDENKDEICDVCNETFANKEETTTPDDSNTTEDTEHTCEEATGFKALITAIINFFRRLLGQPEVCTCGEVIVEKKD